MPKTTISNNDDVIDSRDVIARIEELQSAFDNAQEEHAGDLETMEDGKEIYLADDFNSNDYEELRSLQSLASEAEGCADWKYGETLIRDSCFEDWARELAEDIGLIKSDVAWPYTCIDWERAARELQMDYTSVEFNGVTYWIRS